MLVSLNEKFQQGLSATRPFPLSHVDHLRWPFYDQGEFASEAPLMNLHDKQASSTDKGDLFWSFK